MATELTCPKCQGTMRNYERNGIQIDQCTECRGVWLDRGELERLLDAESAYTQAAQQSGAATGNPGGPFPGPPPPGNPPPAYGWDQGGHHGKSGHGEHGGQRGRRKTGFLGELFD